MKLKTTNKEYTRIVNLTRTPQKLWRENPNLFIETFQGLPLGKGNPLAYPAATLEELITTDGGESFITQRVTNSEATLLGKKGFVSKNEGLLKRWRKK